jgi:hypothetical protein
MGEKKNTLKISVRKLEKRDDSEELRVDGRVN